MKDHNFVNEDGEHIPVSQMPTADILECLAGGVEIQASDGEAPAPENVMERLRIELIIRELDL